MPVTVTGTYAIIMPVKDRLPLLREAVDSIERQTFRDWELILVDDGSGAEVTDWAGEACARDARIRWIERPGEVRPGPSSCRNLGARATGARYLIFLDSDDVLAPDCLEGRDRRVRERPELHMWVFQGERFDERPGDLGQPWRDFREQDDLRAFLTMVTPWCISGPVWEAETFHRIGGFDLELPSWQDLEIHVRALAMGVTYAKFDQRDHYIREPRIENGNISSQTLIYAETHVPAVRRMQARLQAADRLDRMSRLQLQGMILHICGKEVSRSGQAGLGWRCWHRAGTDGWNGLAAWLTGFAWLATCRRPRIRRLVEVPMRLIGGEVFPPRD